MKFSRDRGVADWSVEYNELALSPFSLSLSLSLSLLSLSLSPPCRRCPRVFGAEPCTSFVYNSIYLRARAQHTGPAPEIKVLEWHEPIANRKRARRPYGTRKTWAGLSRLNQWEGDARRGRGGCRVKSVRGVCSAHKTAHLANRFRPDAARRSGEYDEGAVSGAKVAGN